MRRARGGSSPQAERGGARLSVCESLQRLDSAAESRSGGKSRGAGKQIVDSLP